MKNREYIKDLKEMTAPSLLKELDKINNEISLTRNALSFGKEKNTKKILSLRKNRARVWEIIYKKMNPVEYPLDQQNVQQGKGEKNAK